MNIGVAFAPLVSTQILWAVIAATALLALILFASRSRGAEVRTLALALIALALANPSFTREDRDPLTSVAVVVVDKSPSQNFGDRLQQTEAARDKILSSRIVWPLRTTRASQSKASSCAGVGSPSCTTNA